MNTSIMNTCTLSIKLKTCVLDMYNIDYMYAYMCVYVDISTDRGKV